MLTTMALIPSEGPGLTQAKLDAISDRIAIGWERFDEALCAYPDTAWDRISVYQSRFRKDGRSMAEAERGEPSPAIRPAPPLQAENTVRFVAISDTHAQEGRMSMDIPLGDVLVHAGDFSNTGTLKDLQAFGRWMSGQPHRHKIVIAGNHDLSLDPTSYPKTGPRFGHKNLISYQEARAALGPDIIYLEDSGVTVAGIHVWGSPWQPRFCDWAFNLDRGEACKQKWLKIPANTDVLLTHGPPIGHGDLCKGDNRAGCVDLLREVQLRIKPQYHIFGHIHEGYGVTFDGQTTFVNASTCSYNYKPSQSPIVLDVPITPPLK